MDKKVFTEEEIQFGKAVNCWNRLFGWIDFSDLDSLTKVKLMKLLDMILPVLKSNPMYEDFDKSGLREESWEACIADFEKFLTEAYAAGKDIKGLNIN